MLVCMIAPTLWYPQLMLKKTPILLSIQFRHHILIYCRVNYPLVAWAACLSQAEISNAGIFSKRTNMFL